jgi:flagellar hook protein FlgE
MGATFSTPLSGLRASSTSLAITGNNIANANTTGFKRDSVNFADIFVGTSLRNNAGFPIQVGNGVVVSGTTTDFSQASLRETGVSSNFAIQGEGYFVVREGELQRFTRAGDFVFDRSGFLVTRAGQRVQGFAAANGAIAPGTPASDLQIPVGTTIQPQATTEATILANLDSRLPNGAVFTAPVQVFDSLGTQRTLNVTFTKTAAQTYDITANVDGTPVTNLSAAQVTFDANGQLVAPAALTITPDPAGLNGATLGPIGVGLIQPGPPPVSNVTNFSTPSSVSITRQNGFGSGTLSSVVTDRDGSVRGVFSNGQSRLIGQIALARFTSQDGLEKIGGSLFAATAASGDPAIGAPTAGGRGLIVSGSIEESNVDLATEFTSLIVAQRSFQANSRVITTINQTLQDIIQVI